VIGVSFCRLNKSLDDDDQLLVFITFIKRHDVYEEENYPKDMKYREEKI
jgi:hypothetical protein